MILIKLKGPKHRIQFLISDHFKGLKPLKTCNPSRYTYQAGICFT